MKKDQRARLLINYLRELKGLIETTNSHMAFHSDLEESVKVASKEIENILIDDAGSSSQDEIVINPSRLFAPPHLQKSQDC